MLRTMDTSLEPQNAASNAAATHSNASMYTLLVALAAIAMIAGAAYFFMGRDAATGVVDTAAPIQSNETLSSSDDEAAIAADADEAYIQQLEADINADLSAIDQY